MFTPLTELFLIGLLVGLILGLILGMLFGSFLSRWHHAQAMRHLTQMAATATANAGRPSRPRINPYDHSAYDEEAADMFR